MYTNTELESAVRAALQADPRIKHPELIAVSVDEIGTVVLHGAVGTLRQHMAAVHDARDIDGVFEVIADDLSVHPPISGKRSDDELSAAAMQQVIRDSRIRSNHINVTVSHGWVTLTGSVTHESERDAAVDDVMNLAGVHGVIDELKLH